LPDGSSKFAYYTEIPYILKFLGDSVSVALEHL